MDNTDATPEDVQLLQGRFARMYPDHKPLGAGEAESVVRLLKKTPAWKRLVREEEKLNG